jgi:8-oxo-dGTP pyrophosphatase MutT (NUDIX family)
MSHTVSVEHSTAMGAHVDDETLANEPPSRALALADATVLATWFRTQLAQTPPALPPEFESPSPAVRVAAVLALLYPRAEAPYLLFTRRSPLLSSHRGEISFPGGSADPGDADLAATALRETWEEIQLPPEGVQILGALPPMFTVVSNFWIAPLVGWLPDGLPQLTPNPGEVEEIIEASVARLANPAIFHTENWMRGGMERTVHFYDYGAYHIWGVTGQLLSSLLTLLPPEQSGE